MSHLSIWLVPIHPIKLRDGYHVAHLYTIFLEYLNERKHSDKYIFYTLRFDCSFAAANTIKPQLL